MTNIEQMIDYAASGELVKANAEFRDAMQSKMSDALDQEKIRWAGQIFNGTKDDEENIDVDLADYDEDFDPDEDDE